MRRDKTDTGLSTLSNPLVSLPMDERKDNRKHQWKRAQLSAGQVDRLIKAREEWLKQDAGTSNEDSVKNLIASTKTYLSHGYLSSLHSSYLPALADSDFEESRIGAFEVTRWVLNPEENPLDKLTNVYQAFSKENCNIALIFNRKTTGCKVYFAVCSRKDDFQSTEVTNFLLPLAKKSFQGNFPGAVCCDIGTQTVSDLFTTDEGKSVAIVSNLASEKSEKFLSQTLEKLIDGMMPISDSEEYSIVMIASPVNDYDDKLRVISNAYTALSSQAEVQMNTSMAENISVSSAATKGLSVGGGISAGGSAGIPLVAEGHVEVHAHVDGHWDSTMTEAQGFDHSEGKTVTYTNYDVKYVLNLLEKAMQRLEQCKATGMWNYATYIVSNDEPMAHNVAHMYAALVQGEESYLEESAVNIWTRDDSFTPLKKDTSESREEDENEDIPSADVILTSLSRLHHPEFILNSELEKHDMIRFPVLTDATNTISTIELSRAMNFPGKSVSGFPVTESAAFGRSISLLDEEKEPAPKIKVGDIWHMRKADGGKVELDTNLLTSHVFITGSTGSGKSNTVYQLLNKLAIDNDDKKTFLVVEPTKGEYKTIFGGRSDVSVYGTNFQTTDLLRINPFSFPDGIQLYAHLDKLIEIFNACWPMYAAMPAVLKDAMERAYIDAGWNLASSENPYGRLFPTFVDVLRQIDIVMNESDYSGDSKGDYKGALKTRLKSLTNGVYSQIFTCDECSASELFDKNVIVDLSEIGMETTSLIMGILVLKLQEYRMASKAMNSDLKHITVLEEAHNLLKRTSTEQSAEGSNLVGKSVEMITNAIAEMRTYGECFMIVDQAPGALDPAAIRNTNTKIVLRLPDYSDRELVGKSIGLNDYQVVELGKLERGVAAVYQSGWIESVLCKFEEFKEKNPFSNSSPVQNQHHPASILLNAVLYGTQFAELAGPAIKGTKNSIILRSNLPVSLKKMVSELCSSEEPITKEQLGKIAYELVDGEALFASGNEPRLPEIAHRLFRNYQINAATLEQSNLVFLNDLVKQEHLRRERELAYNWQSGGVR